MFSSKAVFAIALIALGCFSCGQSLKCYVCNSKETCNKAVLYECNSSLANDARIYLHSYYSGIDFKTTSNTYNCLKDNLNITSGNHYYKGCIYDTVEACNLNNKGTTGSLSRTCDQCNNSGCNPAGVVNINVMTVFAAILLVFVASWIK